MELATRMTLYNKTNLAESQLVDTRKPYADHICEALGWQVKEGKANGSLMQGLRALCECGAIKKISRGIYQINSSYASKCK